MTSNKKVLFKAAAILLVLLIIGHTASSQQTGTLDQAALQERLISAFHDGQFEVMAAHIHNHRLMIKPFVDLLITEILKHRLGGQSAEAGLKLGMAGKVSEQFHKCFGEKSLVTAVGYVSRWSPDQMREKLLADSLYEAGTRLRGKADTRDQALDCYLRALDLYQTIGDRRGEGTTPGGLGVIYWYRKKEGSTEHDEGVKGSKDPRKAGSPELKRLEKRKKTIVKAMK